MEEEYNPNEIAFELHKIEKGDFHINTSYAKEPAKTLVCSVCGADKFIVGSGDYFTAIKCINCGYEICVHRG